MRPTIALAALMLAAAPARAQDPAANVRIVLERTACFGTCPVYTVTLDGSGAVSYNGRSYVRVSGAHAWNIDAAAVRELAREMEQAGFFEMRDEYTMMVTDLPTTYTTLTIGQRTKRIRDYFGAPSQLKQLEIRIDELSGASGYVRVTAPLIREMQKKGWRAAGDEARQWMDSALDTGDAAMVRALLDAGADPRAVDDRGVTPVMKAASSGDPDTVRVLLAAGGDPTARDKSGRNAADRARDGLAAAARGGMEVVAATGRPRDYALIIRLLTDE